MTSASADKVISTFFLMFCVATTAFGQTPDFGAKYRKVISYEVRPGILMTPKYSADGQVCEMVLERRIKTETGLFFGSSFSEKEVNELVDELVPVAERGKDMTNYFLNASIDGGLVTTEYTYENVLVSVYGVTRPEAEDTVIIVAWRHRNCVQRPPPAASDKPKK